jgi:glycosyltransferase involved in cell wall biosynthesis
MLITAVIPVFNRAEVVGRAIESVLAQELPAGYSLRVLIVDDASTDNLAGALARFGGKVDCIRHLQNAGSPAARNTGVAAAADGLVAFLDSDDVWLPGKLIRQVDANSSNGWLASCHAFHFTPSRGAGVPAPSYRTGTLGLDDFVWGCFVGPGSTLMCRRDVLVEVGPQDQAFRRHEDWDWFLRFARKHRLGFLAEPLARTFPSPHANAPEIVAALARLRAKHASHLSTRQRRHFLAGMDLELAAAWYRSGNLPGMVMPLVRSILRAPTGNAALAVVLHNRFAHRRCEHD